MRLEKAAAEAVRLTQELVRIPSENSPDQGACESRVHDFLCDYLRGRGIAPRSQEAGEDRRNIVVAFPAKNRPKVVIVGHMDTVPAGGMSNPFDGQINGGRIRGRGACDDKGPLATALAVLLALVESSEPPACNLTVVASVDEEGGMRGAKALAGTIGRFDLCVALEPTRRRVVTAHKGVYRAAITTRGKAVHSSQPGQGVNAIDAMLPICSKLQELSRGLSAREDGQLGRSTLTMTQIGGGTAPNVVPDRCELVIDVRLLPELDPAAVEQQLRAHCGPDATLQTLLSCRGIRTDPEIPIIRTLRQCTARDGGDQAPGAAHYCTDCSQLANLGPCVVWGPGDIAQAHGTDEYIEVSEIETACRTLWDFLRNMPLQ